MDDPATNDHMMTLPKLTIAVAIICISEHSFSTTSRNQLDFDTLAHVPSKDSNYLENSLGCYEANNNFVQQGIDNQFLRLNCIEAKKGNSRAEHNVGQVYFLSEGVGEPNPGSLNWFSKAAAQGLPNAQYALAILYFADRAVVGDFEKATQWMLKAAVNGQVDAQYWLGLGFGRFSNLSKSKKLNRSLQWLRKAAEQDHALAKEVLNNICAIASSTFNSVESNVKTNPFDLTQSDCPDKNAEIHISGPGERLEKDLESKVFLFKSSARYIGYNKKDLEEALRRDSSEYVDLMGSNFSAFATVHGAGFMKF